MWELILLKNSFLFSYTQHALNVSPKNPILLGPIQKSFQLKFLNFYMNIK
ncbi:hypothetical protein LEP1GSC132_1052 [Leptospira kirschneri str. 200803703]|uniref:Uncharacterized protein n=1 Tax=Leptospira kirschneri str. 200802841 TaxID=1193047 RepID=A0A828Y7H5_9LEPT|nr:hypothetical protein LEP1GSC131_0851 [Leptospira kirschneri str. 200802841]EKP05978.1 hypothetical protein LEP1GSC018_2247 [Leptospira kirschneri str. 2008720114]EMK19221.1 hypothetical protein LEP1GSC042_2295 [Leptospira kirschneri serovar Bim str. PUO 1247]EMN03284.1 hypothetical protein LEP1GSC046_3067 [Leptospira kirschneri serovar Bim str. 1051]EMO66573.1 hypothetical protein LEP1GSC132_1052 [Leptospira kirschneri str. 200803703]EMO80970.1 hypothetical protein LEP1GSC126_3622 [Leptospi